MSSRFDFDSVQHFTAGAVGEPGQRVFYLQVQSLDTLVTIKCEKQQVAGLAEYLSGVMADLPPVDAPPAIMELLEPVVAEWTVGAMSIAYDEVRDQVVLQLEELVLEEEGESVRDDDESGRMRMWVSRGQVVGFIEHSLELVGSGRPPCPICGHPRGPEHVCPRSNGHHAPS